MASKLDSIVANPSWTKAQQLFFSRLKDGLPVVMSYLADEIPVMDNHTLASVVDETGLLKQIKKPVEKAEKAHVERLKAKLGETDGAKGDSYEASYRGSKRVILNQELCKETIAAFDEEGISIQRLLSAIKAGQVLVPDNVVLKSETPKEDGQGMNPAETNFQVFHTTAAGGRSLYVEPIT